jgi:hypothetical protein
MVYSINTVNRWSGVFLGLSLLLHVGMGGMATWASRRSHDDHAKPKPAFAGETFDVAGVVEERVAAPITGTAAPEIAAPGETARAIANPAAPHAASTTNAPAVDVPLTYGAVGDRSASSVLVTLARGFPQAASTDDIWKTVALGDAGTATMEVELAEDGTVARWSLGQGASLALRQGIVRTMQLVGGRAFIARGAITRLKVEGRVTTDAVRDGPEAVYAIHSEHDGDKASAYFSLSTGRRIDLVLTVVK